jgi:hypothetical protein
MKTLRLNRAESAAYTNGERRFWRAMRKQPVADKGYFGGLVVHMKKASYSIRSIQEFGLYTEYCPYGKPGDRITLTHGLSRATLPITAITVEQRGGRWGWVVEVGA